VSVRSRSLLAAAWSLIPVSLLALQLVADACKRW
jgi:hypothetical protein